jgi:photosystem II stability/assembly factor-like uncharacterized protein
MVLLLLLLAGCTETPRAADGRAIGTPTPAPAQLDRILLDPHFGPIDATFIDRDRGWALGSTCTNTGVCHPALKATSDGGLTWEFRSAPPTSVGWSPPQFDALSGGGVSRLHFADAEHGWAFRSELFVTHDGGLTWARDDRLGHVIDLAAVGPSVWAVADKCPAHAEGPCLMISSDFGRTWVPPPGPPRIAGTNVQVVRSGSRDGWLASSGIFTGVLAATQDGGRTWEEFPFSCCARQFRLAASEGTKLWVIYGGVGATMNQPKWLYVSDDGGRSWNLSKEPGMLGNAPLHGTLMDLAAASDERLFMTDLRGPFSVTSDGGQTWRLLFPGEFDRWSGLRVTFVDEQHGWAISTGRIWRTTDGGETWKALLL